uniref:Uncharacterized protein n=1 Tax=Anopheles christyi TaxID=43041 RepID=A0A182KHU6_9DIPT
MVRSYSPVLFVAVVLFVSVLPVVEMSGNSMERVATVELLPNDLIQVDRPKEETIANPVQVIEKHVEKTWQAIVKRMLDDTRTGLKHKRNLGVNPYTMVDVIRLFMMVLPLIRAGLIPQHALGSGLQTVPSMGSPGVSSLAAASGALATTNKAGINNSPLAAVAGASSLAGTGMVLGSVASNPVTGGVPLPGGLPGGAMVPGMVADIPVTGNVPPMVQGMVPGGGNSVPSLPNYAHILPSTSIAQDVVPGGVAYSAVTGNISPLVGSGSGLPGSIKSPGKVPASFYNYVVPRAPLSDRSLAAGPFLGSGSVAGSDIPSSITSLNGSGTGQVVGSMAKVI